MDENNEYINYVKINYFNISFNDSNLDDNNSDNENQPNKDYITKICYNSNSLNNIIIKLSFFGKKNL